MRKALDLTNQVFGRLTVLERAEDYVPKSGKKLVQWKCLCECGNICYATTKLLRNGKTKSCGCLRKEKTIERNKHTVKDLTGQKFGKLTALYPTEKRTIENYVIWHCKCDCGNECDVGSGYLLRGNVKSCGCLIKEKNAEKIKDLTGQRFGKLVAIKPTEKRNGTSVIWQCKCDCGNECYVRSSALCQKLTQSCGCLTNSIGEEKIAEILRDNKISFERQKTFDNCRFMDTNALAKFDFYLPDQNYIIEYDGVQHYMPRQFGGCTLDQAKKNFEKTQLHDDYKTQWCEKNNIRLIRIPYTKINNLKLQDLLLQEE